MWRAPAQNTATSNTACASKMEQAQHGNAYSTITTAGNASSYNQDKHTARFFKRTSAPTLTKGLLTHTKQALDILHDIYTSGVFLPLHSHTAHNVAQTAAACRRVTSTAGCMHCACIAPTHTQMLAMRGNDQLPHCSRHRVQAFFMGSVPQCPSCKATTHAGPPFVAASEHNPSQQQAAAAGHQTYALQRIDALQAYNTRPKTLHAISAASNLQAQHNSAHQRRRRSLHQCLEAQH